MSEERLMILKMISDGKVTPEQGEALLKAIPPDSSPEPNDAHTSSGSTKLPHGAFGDLQGRLADVQVKLGELQSKLGAAATSAAPPSSTNGSPLPFGLGDLNVGQMIDEAVRGVNGLKSESVRTFKLAARAAQKEGRRIKKEAKNTGKSFGIDLSLNSVESGRPRNDAQAPTHSTTEQMPLNLNGIAVLKVVNLLGDVKVVSSTGVQPCLKFKRQTWSSVPATLAYLDTLIPQIVVADNGTASEVIVVADSSKSDGITVDIELSVPDTLVANVETTFGNVHCEGRSSGVGTIETSTGGVHLLSIRGDGAVESSVRTRSGGVSISHWDGPSIVVETVSGPVTVESFAGIGADLRARSGELSLTNVRFSGALYLESSSGDISLTSAAVGRMLTLKTQSGDICVKNGAAEDVRVESVSGDLLLTELSTGEGGVTLDTVSGDIDTSSQVIETMAATTVSGDINAHFTLPFTGTLVATTISGDVSVAVPAQSGVTVELSSQSGSVRSTASLVDENAIGEKYLKGALNSGTGKVTVQSVSGDVTLKS